MIASYGKQLAAVAQSVVAVFFSVFYHTQTVALYFVPRALRRHDVTGKLALITGGGSGIGRLVALRLAARGCKIVVWDINTEG